ncbi:kinase binding protein CGI-121-domain-containing protein [Neurospora crassa]|nr:kinase binding protein CGI-121-domain-containing protein [Neurospora crassa]
MALETLQIEHVPSDHHVYAALFRDVQNVDFLQAQLIGKNPEFEYAFIDASVIISRTHLFAAIFRALNTLTEGTLQTPNVHSDIVIGLSPTNNISESYRRYGLTPSKTRDVLVIKVVYPKLSSENSTITSEQQPTPESIWQHLTTHIQGTPVPLTNEEFTKSTDWAKVRKYYKLNGVPDVERIDKADEEGRRKEMEGLVISGIALRGL